jgi:hypothetical protein
MVHDAIAAEWKAMQRATGARVEIPVYGVLQIGLVLGWNEVREWAIA